MILCGGESLIDMIPCEAEDGRSCFSPHVGGSVYNTALALGRLGANVGLVSGLSSDLFGILLRDKLASSNVSLEHLVIRDLPTTLAFVSITDGQAKYAFYDENTASRTLTEDFLPDIPDKASAVFVGGISLIAEPCGTAFETLAVRACSDRVVMCDPNVRPNFISDEAAFRRRLEVLWRNADVVKLSDEDIKWICPDPSDAESLASRILELGAKIVVVTKGAKGSVGHTRGFSVQVPAQFAEVVDTVGAGDAFNAGLLTYFAENGLLSKSGLESLSESNLVAALEFGSAVAGASVARPGADPPWLNEIKLS